jgi:hypothetical protein
MVNMNRLSNEDRIRVISCLMYYNFARKHQTLKMSPAMAAGITNKLWTIADIVALIDNSN